jgi:hypothetical protein
MKLSSATDAYPGPDLDGRPKFNVVIIYQDSAAGKRAKHFFDRVIRELVDECDFSLELWNFRVLAVPEIGNSAAKAAARADFVILSMHRKAQLSVQTRDWIERWSGLITDSKSALVALLDQPGMKRGTVASTLDYLRKVADRKGISFYTHTTFGLSTNYYRKERLCLHGLTVRRRTKCLIFRRPAP